MAKHKPEPTPVYFVSFRGYGREETKPKRGAPHAWRDITLRVPAHSADQAIAHIVARYVTSGSPRATRLERDVPCDCGAHDATWHCPEFGARTYCCDACAKRLGLES